MRGLRVWRGALCFAGLAALLAAGCETAPGEGAEQDAEDRADVAASSGPGAGTEEAPPAPAPEPVRDDKGRQVALDEPAERVVSLVPSTTELIVAMGGQDRLVARTRHDGDPRLAELPSIGTGMEPNLEALGALAPDLVVVQEMASERRVTGRLKALGIPVYVSRSGTIEDVRRHALQVGELLGLRSEADSLVGAMDRDLAEVAARVEGAEPAEVLYILHPDPPFTTGSGTYLHQVIEAAGGSNAFADLEAEWPEVSMEAVVRRDPEALVVSRGHVDRGADGDWVHRRAGWRSLTAVEEGRVLTVDPDLFNRPGPRVAEAARTLARFLHPERFGGDDGP